MIINEMDDRTLALAYTHYIYRNTELEDYHAQNALMNDELYEKMYRVVAKNIRTVQRNHAVLSSLSNVNEMEQYLRSLGPSTRSVNFIRFAQAMATYQLCPYGSDWDTATAVAEEIPKDRVAFLLNGCFRECCDAHCCLDDIAMCRINKDVHNRVYTLCCVKAFA